MIIYLAVFGLSAVLFAHSERASREWEKKLCVFLAVLIPAVLAGCRGPSIGTDVRVYGRPDFRSALRANGLIQYFASRRAALLSEPLYHLIVFTLSRFFSNYHWALFAYNLITILFTYAGMKRFHRQMDTPIWLGMLLYYLAMYNTTLNTMRQSMAIAAVFFASTFLLEKKYWHFVLLTCVGIGFHTSAALCLALLPMYFLLRQDRTVSINQYFLRGATFIICVCAAVVMGEAVIRWLVASGFIRANYLTYLDSSAYGGGEVAISALFVYGGYIVFLVLHDKYLRQRQGETLFFLMISCLIFLSRFGQLISVFLPRIGLYLIPLQTVSLANIMNCYSKKSRITWGVLIISYSLLAWFGVYVYKGSSNTVPYIFDISP